MFRLEKLITKLLKEEEYKIVDGILDYLDIEGTSNYFTDLVDIAILCNKYDQKLQGLYWYKNRLSDKIYEQRGEEGKDLINKILGNQHIKYN